MATEGAPKRGRDEAEAPLPESSKRSRSADKLAEDLDEVRVKIDDFIAVVAAHEKDISIMRISEASEIFKQIVNDYSGDMYFIARSQEKIFDIIFKLQEFRLQLTPEQIFELSRTESYDQRLDTLIDLVIKRGIDLEDAYRAVMDTDTRAQAFEHFGLPVDQQPTLEDVEAAIAEDGNDFMQEASSYTGVNPELLEEGGKIKASSRRDLDVSLQFLRSTISALEGEKQNLKTKLKHKNLEIIKTQKANSELQQNIEGEQKLKEKLRHTQILEIRRLKAEYQELQINLQKSQADHKRALDLFGRLINRTTNDLLGILRDELGVYSIKEGNRRSFFPLETTWTKLLQNSEHLFKGHATGDYVLLLVTGEDGESVKNPDLELAVHIKGDMYKLLKREKLDQLNSFHGQSKKTISKTQLIEDIKSLQGEYEGQLIRINNVADEQITFKPSQQFVVISGQPIYYTYYGATIADETLVIADETLRFKNPDAPMFVAPTIEGRYILLSELTDKKIARQYNSVLKKQEIDETDLRAMSEQEQKRQEEQKETEADALDEMSQEGDDSVEDSGEGDSEKNDLKKARLTEQNTDGEGAMQAISPEGLANSSGQMEITDTLTDTEAALAKLQSEPGVENALANMDKFQGGWITADDLWD